MRSPSLSKVLPVAAGLSLWMLAGCQTTGDVVGHVTGWMMWVHRERTNLQTAPTLEKEVKTRGIALSLRLNPFPLSLSEARRVSGVIRLKNISNRFIQLEFPTTQRFELLVRDAGGRMVYQWSEDQAFEAVPSSVGINPGEHVEYIGVFPTRDLRPGQRYTASVFFPSRSDLKVELPFVPEK